MARISGSAVTAVEMAIPVEADDLSAAGQRRRPIIAYAMRPGVIGQEIHAVTHSFLHGQHQALIAAGAAVIHFAHVGVVLTLGWILKVEEPPLVGVVCCRAR